MERYSKGWTDHRAVAREWLNKHMGISDMEWIRDSFEHYELEEDGKVSFICPECKKGRMVFTGMAYLLAPPWNEHKCCECGHMLALQTRTYC